MTEVTVRGRENPAQRSVRSAEAVTVVDLRRAREQTVDLGEVLARSQGVSVRRDGGLGSNANLSLNGLTGEQIRFFLDGVPLEAAGYPFGVANVPVNLVERVEIFRGVVPVRFGADALGGAVNLVTDTTFAPRLSASYQTGSNGLHRLTAEGRTRHADTGLVVGASTFVDRAKNNYDVDVKIVNAAGREADARVPRFHDGYSAVGGAVEVGFIDRPWARRLTGRAFATGFDKDVQSNLVMTGAPYGEVTRSERVYGGTLRYEQPLARDLELDLVANYARRFIHFVDVGEGVYDWFGRRIVSNNQPGEVDNVPRDQAFWQGTFFGRATATWAAVEGHVLRVSTAPAFTSRDGEERRTASGVRDRQDVPRELFALNSGLEYEANLFGGRLQNIASAKSYLYASRSEDLSTGQRVRVDRRPLGVGDAVRYRVSDWLYAKASYERATRLPGPDEVFGDGALIGANTALQPEVSHNVNLGPHIELRRTSAGDIVVDADTFLRDTDNLISVIPAALNSTYQNVGSARSLGFEAGGSWVLPGRWLALDGSFTYNDLRNTSTGGTFERERGDRIPSRPWLFGSWGARLRFKGLPGPADSIEPFYVGRYVHSFYRAWESQGAAAFKQVVDAQTTHVAGVTWTVFADGARVASTVEVDNLTDARVFDVFGAQRPGRQFFIKSAIELR